MTEENKSTIIVSCEMGFLGAVAAAAAKSLQSCPTLCDPIDDSPPGSSIPGILQARILGGPALKTLHSQCRGQVQFLVRKLESSCHN